jgi:hypothetical protein
MRRRVAASPPRLAFINALNSTSLADMYLFLYYS